MNFILARVAISVFKRFEKKPPLAGDGSLAVGDSTIFWILSLEFEDGSKITVIVPTARSRQDFVENY